MGFRWENMRDFREFIELSGLLFHSVFLTRDEFEVFFLVILL